MNLSNRYKAPRSDYRLLKPGDSVANVEASIHLDAHVVLKISYTQGNCPYYDRVNSRCGSTLNNKKVCFSEGFFVEGYYKSGHYPLCTRKIRDFKGREYGG